jgi:phosphoribosylpyrophosphate synthetase
VERIVEQLLAAGAQIDSTDEKQQTLLHQLCESISSSCVKTRFSKFYDDKESVKIEQESQLRLHQIFIVLPTAAE